MSTRILRHAKVVVQKLGVGKDTKDTSPYAPYVPLALPHFLGAVFWKKS